MVGGKMQKPTKVLLAVATLWPIVYMFIFIAFFFSAFFWGPGSAETGTGTGMPPAMALFFLVHLLTMLFVLALTVFYIVNIFRNDRVEKDKKARWAIVIFMGSAIAMPIYWYLYIWKEANAGGPPPPDQLYSGNSTSWTNQASQPGASQRQEQYVPPPRPPNWRE
jgi:glucan phosphoethanolaminetransferase (alkaline phosphatase superfamily)